MSRQVLVDLDFNSAAKVINLPNPTSDQDAATKAYVDNAVEGLAWKDSVRVASTANITLSGPGATIDGITMVANDRVLVKDQTAPAENGIYIWNGSAIAMTRSVDAGTFYELEQAIVSVEEGTSGDASFRQTEVNGTLGTTPISFSSFGTVAPSATESVAGIAEIATQTETDTGTDDTRFITPHKLANHTGRKFKFSQTIGDGSATSFNVDHNFNTRDVTIAIYRNSGSYDEIMADITRPSVNRVTISFAVAPASSAHRVVIIG